jgi:prevent-host-death family protein
MPEREPMTQTMTASQACGQWSQVLDKVYRKEARVLVEQNGIPVAAIVSADDLQQLQRLEAEETKALARMRSAFAGKTDDEIMDEVAGVVEEVRQEQRMRRAEQP